ncbi:MAG: hypothetical protein Q9218_001145 [Villophora microphyllina]
MGLSGPRKRAKYSHDPNNTAWARSSSSFGQKLLLSQGWKPGSVLGAHNASYADSPASLSHIKITLRDENSGLGSRNGAQGGEDTTTGLDGLQDLLGRLNGKHQHTRESEQRSREDTRRALYADRRWGFDRFVSGGFLVGDRIQHGNEEQSTQAVLPTSTNLLSTVSRSKGTATKSRPKKIKQAGGSIGTSIANASKSGTILSTDRCGEPPKSKEINRKTEQSRVVTEHALQEQRRLEKTDSKIRREARKAEKAAAEVSKLKRPTQPSIVPPVLQLEAQKSTDKPPAAEVEKTHARHAVRRRFIQHKNMSLTDQKALNEILMIRA